MLKSKTMTVVEMIHMIFHFGRGRALPDPMWLYNCAGIYSAVWQDLEGNFV